MLNIFRIFPLHFNDIQCFSAESLDIIKAAGEAARRSTRVVTVSHVFATMTDMGALPPFLSTKCGRDLLLAYQLLSSEESALGHLVLEYRLDDIAFKGLAYAMQWRIRHKHRKVSLEALALGMLEAAGEAHKTELNLLVSLSPELQSVAGRNLLDDVNTFADDPACRCNFLVESDISIALNGCNRSFYALRVISHRFVQGYFMRFSLSLILSLVMLGCVGLLLILNIYPSTFNYKILLLFATRSILVAATFCFVFLTVVMIYADMKRLLED